MIAIARTKPPSASAAPIEYLVSPAAPLEVESGAFDVVTCQQGLQFFPDRPASIREMHRALKPSGRVAAAVWREIGCQPAFAALDAALRECVSADQAEPYGLPFRWPRAEDLGDAFRREGFTGVSVAEVRHPVIYEGGIAQVIASLAASPVAGTIAELDAPTRARLWSAAERRLTLLVVGGQVQTEMVSNLVTAWKGGVGARNLN